jgi:MoaA/NifB/PqqE/SkfB family radical SAM enzyme
MSLIKAEILLSSKCNLACEGCHMATGEENTRTVEEWKKGLSFLTKEGCQFFAFYGAEPLLEFEKLVACVPHCEEVLKVPCTVITSGKVKNFRAKVKKLHKAGMRSLTMSYTPDSSCASTRSKSSTVLGDLEYFSQLGGIRDIAAIVTLTPDNIEKLPETIKELSLRNIWVFFDLLHQSYHPGSKCSFVKGVDPLWFFKKDYSSIFAEVLKLKEEGYLVHPTQDFFEQVLGGKLWKCSSYEEFPSWVTIDHHGKVRPCDDFCGGATMDMLSIPGFWDRWVEKQRKIIETKCNGCCWCTHIQAHSIKKGTMPLTQYIHGACK